MKTANEDAKSNCWVQNEGNSCVLRAFIDKRKTKVMAAPTLKAPLRKGYFTHLKDLTWPSDEIVFELLIGVILRHSSVACSSQTFYNLEGGRIAYCAGQLR